MDSDADRAGPSHAPLDPDPTTDEIPSFDDEEQDQVYPLPTLQPQADTYSAQPQPHYQTQTQIREPSPSTRPLSGASSSTHGYANGQGSATGSVSASPPPAPPSKDDHDDQLEYLDQGPARMTPPVPQITVVPYTPPTLQTSVSVPSSPPPIVPPRPDSLHSLQPPSQTQTQQYQINTVLPPVQPYVQPYSTQPQPKPQPQAHPQPQVHIRTPARTPTTTPRLQNQNPGAYIPAPAEPYPPYALRRSPSPIRGTVDDGRYPSPAARPPSGAYNGQGHGHAGSASGSGSGSAGGSGNASPVGPGAAPYAGMAMSMPGAYDPPAGPPPFARAVSYSAPASAAMPARPPRAMSYAERPPTGRSSRYNSLNGNGNGNGSVTGYGGGMGSAGANGNGSAMAGGTGLGDAAMRRSMLDHTVPVVHEDGSMVSTAPTGKGGEKNVDERLQPTLEAAERELKKYQLQARATGWSLNFAIGAQVVLGALTTGVAAATSGHKASIATSVLGGMSTLAASYLAKARGSGEPEASDAMVAELASFVRDCRACMLDRGHLVGGAHDDVVRAFRERFEAILGNRPKGLGERLKERFGHAHESGAGV